MKESLVVVLVALATLAGCQEPNIETQQSDSETPAGLDIPLSARDSLDWHGMYRGIVPCSHCEGTNLLLELTMDGQYSLSRSYVDKMSATVMEEGQITWNEDGNIIHVGVYQFFVTENKLVLADQNEQRVVDGESKPYILSKD